ncbi:MAG: exosome complex RNA-binding protein Csl4 [Thermoplasmatota archaeon]
MEKLIEPGTPLATSEELLPGPNTYDDGTDVRAAVYGTESIDTKEMAIGIKPTGRGVAKIDRGDIVVGEVTVVRPQLASVNVVAVRGKEGRSIHQAVEATLFVSGIDRRYIKEVSEEFQAGDLIRAKVLKLKGGPNLVTDSPDFGIVSARCGCGVRMEKDGKRLKCPECNRSRTGKIANDYGSGHI